MTQMDLTEREDDRTARIKVFVPVGAHLRIPAKLWVDDDTPWHIPQSWRLSNGDIASDVACAKVHWGNGGGKDA